MHPELPKILASIDELANRGKISRQRAFAAWFAINFHDLDEDDALEAAAADGGNDQGIDIAFVDESSQEIVIIQAHCPENFSKQTEKKKWDAVAASVPFINQPKNLADAGRPDLAESLLQLKADHPDFTFAVGLITLGLKSNEIAQSFQAHRKAAENSKMSFFLQPTGRYLFALCRFGCGRGRYPRRFAAFCWESF